MAQTPYSSHIRPHASVVHPLRPDWHAQLEALVRVHEPHRVHQVGELLRTFAGMERELLQCYRHHYTGAGGFRVGSASRFASPTGGTTSSAKLQREPATVFSLPKAAIATYLREKLRARRSSQVVSGASENPATSSSCAKGDDVRSPEMLLPTATRHHGDRDARDRSAVRPLPSLNVSRRAA